MSASAAANQKELMLNELDLGVTSMVIAMIYRIWDVNCSTGRYLSTDFIVSDRKVYSAHSDCLYTLLDVMFGSIANQPQLQELDGDTVVRKYSVSSDGFDRHPFQFVEFDSLEPTNNKYLIDAAGYVTNVGRTTQQKSGSKTLDFHLANIRGQSLRVTLWGRLGDMLIEKRTCHVRLYLIVLTAMSVKLYNSKTRRLLNSLYLSSTSSTLIVDDEQIPVLKWLKTNDSGVELSKEMLPSDNTEAKAGTLENLLICARNRKYDVSNLPYDIPLCLSEQRRVGTTHHVVVKNVRKVTSTARTANFGVTPATVQLELEISDATAEAVVVMFDETAKSLVRCSTSSIVGSEDQEEGDSGLPPALANIVGTSHTLEIKSHTSGTVVATADPKAPVLKNLAATPSVTTPSKSGELQKPQRWVILEMTSKIPMQKSPLLQTVRQREETWAVLRTHGKGKGNNHVVRPSLSNILHTSVTIHSNTIIKRDGNLQSFCCLKLSDIRIPDTGTSSKLGKQATGLKGKTIADTPNPAISEPTQITMGIGHKRLTKKGRKPTALASSGVMFLVIALVLHPTNVVVAMLPCGMRKEITREIGFQTQHSHYAANKVTQPRYARLWFFDTHNEIRNRLGAFVDNDSDQGLDGTIVGSDLRYMMQNYQDIMALCCGYGNPDLFITFTSNPKWPEINVMLAYIPGQRAHDRPEVGTRVFKLKLTELLDELTKNKVFGESRAVVYVIEFQKQGMPHAHILLWLKDYYKCKIAADIDDMISPELPSPTDDPVGGGTPEKAAVVDEIKNYLNCRYLAPSYEGTDSELLFAGDSRSIEHEWKNFNGISRLTSPNPALLTNMDNHLIREALAFDMNKSKILHQNFTHRGTKKTFLYKTIISRLRSDLKIVLDASSSGIASLLLPGGRTAHNKFVIPLELLENCTCGIKQNTHLAELMQQVEPIIWDKAPMMQKYAFEALDKTMRYILGYPAPEKQNKLFGGVTMLLGGDFKQILPVIPKGKRAAIVHACINRSEL
ncbi:ATP-dependent DNA helicase PIF1-like protein [Tanacetum coccineum]